jgi:type VI secretion system protein ImpH
VRPVEPILDRLLAEPSAVHVFAALRAIERQRSDLPRIGESATVREDAVRMGQDPTLDFATETINAARRLPGSAGVEGLVDLRVRFLGLLGPQGALPIAFVEEALGYAKRQDDAFPRFLDLFNNRFLQLFFRTWAASQPIAGNDRPEHDRFRAFMGSIIGIAGAALESTDALPDDRKRFFAGLTGAKAASAARLESYLRGLFRETVEVDQCLGSWLVLEPADRTVLGRRNATLGSDALLGAAVLSFEDRFAVTIHAPTLDRYRDFLPNGPIAALLADAVFQMLGDQFVWTVALSLPVAQASPARLGGDCALGWTSWLGDAVCGPVVRREQEDRRQDARFAIGGAMRPIREAA